MFFGKNSDDNIVQAVTSGDLEKVVAALQLNPAAINNRDSYGKTPLIYGVELGFVEVVKLLLQQPNIVVDIADDDGVTAFTKARVDGNEVMQRLLIEAGASTGQPKKSSFVNRGGLLGGSEVYAGPLSDYMMQREILYDGTPREIMQGGVVYGGPPNKDKCDCNSCRIL